ncbi:RodZ domain-containing protein [Oceanospirillum sp.]|uniref:RodZ domain-containing protein n=1 Tax=Oceanospirillum sp. TaxID=2021254 RepID=UPI003A91C39E
MTDTVATHDDTQSDAPLPENMPGEQLKKGRERMQLTTREVSEKLNLKHSFVTQIEEDNYSALPGTTFIRGYLRAYAKLVGVEAEALIDIYNTNFNEEPKPEERYKPVEVIKPQRSSSDPLIKYTTIAVVAALIALSIIWWQSRNGSEPLSLVQSDTVTVETSGGETIIAQMDLSDTDEEGLTEEPAVVPSDTNDEAVSEDDPAITEEIAEELPLTQESATEVGASESGPEAVSVEPTPEEIGQAVSMQARLMITYTEECWIEITDGRGIQVVSNLKQAGEESVVEGVPPFKLMIGNATGAVVSYQGEEVDLKPHTNRNNIARFTLGE